MSQLLASLGSGSGFLDSLEGPLAVDTLDALDNGICHDGDGGIAYHAVRLVAPQVPHGQTSLLVADV